MINYLIKFKLYMQSMRYNRGFTLIELLTSSSLYTMVAVYLIATLLLLSSHDLRLRNKEFAVNNMLLSIETMQRDIKLGSSFRCDPGVSDTGFPVGSVVDTGTSGKVVTADCKYDTSLAINTQGGGNSLIFQSQDGTFVNYYVDSQHKLRKARRHYDPNAAGSHIVNDADQALDSTLSSENVFIKTLLFYVEGTDQGDGRQPIITAKVSADLSTNTDQRGNNQKNPIEMQITITPRGVDG